MIRPSIIRNSAEPTLFPISTVSDYAGSTVYIILGCYCLLAMEFLLLLLFMSCIESSHGQGLIGIMQWMLAIRTSSEAAYNRH